MQTNPVLALRRPAFVESWQWDGTEDQAHRIVNWVEDGGGYGEVHPYELFPIVSGDQVWTGMWVVRTVGSTFDVLPDWKYRAVYEPVLP